MTREEHTAYCRKWHKENKEHAREYAKKWRTENKEQVQAYGREWRKKNKEMHLSNLRKWRAKNKGYMAAFRKRAYENMTGFEYNKYLLRHRRNRALQRIAIRNESLEQIWLDTEKKIQQT